MINTDNDNNLPGQYERRVLLCVVGLSPQIVTETLDVLVTQNEDQRFVPTELHVITTSLGANICRDALIKDKWLEKLVQERGIPTPIFNNSTIHVMTDVGTGEEIDDSRSKMHNSASGDYIIRKVQEFTADASVSLHASLAGGRKTMGYYLGVAMSLFARPQDRLSHILVDADFENRDFFYRTKREEVRYITTRDGKQLDAASARLELADLKFPRLRERMKKTFLKKTSSFLDSLEHDLIPPANDLVMDLENKTVSAGDIVVSLTPREMALLYMLYQYHTEFDRPMPFPYKNPDPENENYIERTAYNREIGQRFLDASVVVYGDASLLRERSVQTLKSAGLTGDSFSSDLSHIRGKFEALPDANRVYQVQKIVESDRSYAQLPTIWKNLHVLDFP